MAEPYLGEIKIFGFNFAPRGWAQCDGQLLAIAQNNALFALLGTNYGGDGRTTFALPDLRGRVPMHHGYGPALTPRPIGQRYGAETTVLTNANLPTASPYVAKTSATTVIGGEVRVRVSDAPGNAAVAASHSLAYVARDSPSTALEIYDKTPTFNDGHILGGVESTLIATTTATTTVSGGLSGGISSAINNLQPYQVVNFGIALMGLFPSRN